MNKVRVNLTVKPKDSQDLRRIQGILLRKGYKLEAITDSLSHYYNRINSLISVRKTFKAQ